MRKTREGIEREREREREKEDDDRVYFSTVSQCVVCV